MWIAILVFLFIIVTLPIYLDLITIFCKPIKYRVVYYIPTGQAVGIIIKYRNKMRFYYYINDLKSRTVGLRYVATERLMKRLKQLIYFETISFDKFEEYFSPNFYITQVIPLFILHDYAVARDLLSGYQNKVLTKKKLQKYLES